jgi:dolichol-phosphate mannosyltransferase
MSISVQEMGDVFETHEALDTRGATMDAQTPEQVRLVCIIPTLNEGLTIGDVVNAAKRCADHVVVIDGGSEDDTATIAEEAGARVLNQAGQGKGDALRTAFAKIPGDVYVTIDGDATYDPLDTPRLVRPIFHDAADMVVGSRLRGKMEHGAITWTNRLGNRFFNGLINAVYGHDISDSQSGFRAVTRRAVELMTLTANGFDIETEMTVKALKRGLRVTELPITYRRRRGTATKLHAIRAGFTILKTLICSML